MSVDAANSSSSNVVNDEEDEDDVVVGIATSKSEHQDGQMSVCRVCLGQVAAMKSLFYEDCLPSLADRLMFLASVKMTPDDGLPSHVCRECGDKLDLAYKFKLQVEQSDAILRQKLDSFNIKDELFLNDIDVNLTSNRNDVQSMVDDNLLLKDHTELLNVEKANEKDDMQIESMEEQTKESVNEFEIEKDESKEEEHESREEKCEETLKDEEMLVDNEAQDQTAHETTADDNNQSFGELQEMMLNEINDQEKMQEELSETQQLAINEHNYVESQLCDDSKDASLNESKENIQKELIDEQPEVHSIKEESVSHESTRRSKRKLAQQKSQQRLSSDEESYFENLNLSSRLKRVQLEKSDKVFYMCYWCDKQFMSRELLREHMYSHEEVRKSLSLVSKSPEKAQIPKTPEKFTIVTSSPTTSVKPNSSGKQANTCPHCGKEYLYVISYKKHLKQHKKEKKNLKDNSVQMEVPLEVSVQQDEDTFDFDHFDDSNVVDSFSESEEKPDVKGAVKTKKETCEQENYTEGKLTEVNAQENVLVEQVPEKDSLDSAKCKPTPEESSESPPKVESNQKHKCPHCPQAFKLRNALTLHLKSHKENHKATPSREAEQSVATRSRSYPCSDCNKCFTNELTFRNHLIATGHTTTIQGEQYDLNKRIKRVAAKAALKVIDKIKTDLSFDESDEEGNGDEDSDANFEEIVVKKIIKEEPAEYVPSESKKVQKSLKSLKALFCASCNQKCTSKQALAKHMEQHMKEENSVKQEKSELEDMEDDDDYEGGIDDWPMDSYECPTCKKKYSTKKSLLRHQLLHEEPNFECDICNVKFYRKDKLKSHYDKCSEKNPDQVRKCNICNDVFENNEALKEHRAKHVAEGILTEEDLLEIDPKPIDKNEDKAPRKRRTDIVGLDCQECNKRYTSRKGLLRHLQVHEARKFLCDMCPKKFYRREHLKIHVAKHNMIKPYKCHKCSKRFMKEELLNNHLLKHERTAMKKPKESSSANSDGGKRFLCEICSKSFTQSTTLVAHLRAHNGIKPYVCEVCSRPFTTNAYLKMHMRTHTKERPYICQYCSRAFARADTLANHLTSHTGEAKYHCQYCPKHFRRLKSLKEHVFIHTGQRPYACPTCDRKFNNNGSRYAHSKRCKQNQQQQQNRQVQMQNQLELQSDELQQEQEEHEEQQVVQATQSQLVITTTASGEQGEHQLQLVEQMDVQGVTQHQVVQRIGTVTTMPTGQIIKPQNIKTITIARPVDGTLGQQHVMGHQEILMPLILPFTVTLGDVGDEVILSEGTKIFTT